MFAIHAESVASMPLALLHIFSGISKNGDKKKVILRDDPHEGLVQKTRDVITPFPHSMFSLSLKH